MSEPQVQRLPPHIEERLAREAADGVTFKRMRVDRAAPGFVTGIQWRPGDRNALAEAIHERVSEEPMRLEIRDREYEIRRVS